MRILIILALLAAPVAGQDLVAKSEARSPEEERKSFKLPPGFEAQLVASEPDIQKPMQLAFDAKGRIWVTTSHHYPFAAKPGEGTDKLFVLSDFDAAGKAGKVQVFDDKLNIPIGVLPLPDGKSAIVGECGSILKLADTDGDGKADARETLFTGFGYDDTHGMTNSYTLLPDGWVYACHGFKNKSRVKGKDGHEIAMESGHTFRFRPDGSRIEIFTKGQVNPFGMCVDPWLNLYTADCHSRPMTQLIRGACYDSFGKPHDGLGFAPHLFNHQHDSTGLCGIAYYAADYYPKEWNGVMFVGNVVTSRINCDRIEWRGATPIGREMPDFLVSSDPWFRPVDLKIGPDGAMYVSDFYNRIVGHYEVDLKHPGRDKDRGRIWRIVRSGEKPPKKANLEQCSADVIMSRGLAATPEWTPDLRKLIRETYLTSSQPQVQRSTLHGIIGQPHAEFVAPLLELIPKIAAEDTHLKMAARIALRNCVVAAGGVGKVEALATAIQKPILFDVALAIRTKDSCAFLAGVVADGKIAEPQLQSGAEFVGRYDSDRGLQLLKDDQTLSLGVIRALLKGLQTAGIKELPLGAEKNILLAVKDTLVVDSKLLPEAAATLKVATSFPDSVPLFQQQTWLGHARRAMSNPVMPMAVRMDLADALVNAAKGGTNFALVELLDANADVRLRSHIAAAMLAKPEADTRGLMEAMLGTAPYPLALAIAGGLASDKEGASSLLDAVRRGKASARLLQDKAVAAKLSALKNPAINAAVKELTKNLPSADKRLDALLKSRAAAYAKVKTDIAKGKEAFAKNCAACHQIGSEGTKIGPQLDGVGIRGLERLLEDTLDPNRNVDHAFRATRFDLKDGRNVSGLLLREEGAVYVVADSVGKEVRIGKDDVETKTVSNLSAMPGNFDTTVPEAEFQNLIAYLLSQKAKK